MSNTKITIEAEISADAKKVWDYFNKPEHITKWNSALDEWHCPSAENDLRVGGKLKSRMEAKDGSVGFDFEAVYDEVINEKKIVYTIADGRQVVTNFENLGNMTKVTTTFEAENENPVEMQRAGWQSILDNFKKYVESN
ncbi:MAG TPA: activator of HSP90 ATPase [Ignavibacteriales bacterium]|nr:activator of HSP90 ATPase [Ignavibacteriales bacterium]